MEDDDKPLLVLSIHCDKGLHESCPGEIDLAMNSITYLTFKCPCHCHGDKKITKEWNTEKQLDEFIKRLKKGLSRTPWKKENNHEFTKDSICNH